MLTATLAHAGVKQLVDVKYDVDPALEGCPDLGEFRSMMAQRLGYDPYRESAENGVEVRARRTEQGLEGRLRWTPAVGPGDRRFVPKGQDCRELMATLAFMVAVQLELTGNGAGADGAPSSAESSAAKVEEAGNRSPSPPPAQSPEAAGTLTSGLASQSADEPSTWTLVTGAGPSVGVAVAPNAVAQGRLFVGAEFRRSAFELGAEGSWPTTRYQPAGGGFRHQMVLGFAAACARYEGLHLCAVAKLGVLRVHGLGVDKAATPAGLVAQSGPRVAYALTLGEHVALLTHVDALFLLTPWKVYVNHAAIWSMPRFGAAAGVDLTIAFR